MDKKEYEYISEDSRQNYRDQIIEMVNKIKSPSILESIYSFIMGILSVNEKQEAD